MPLYVNDYLGDTMHLSPEKHGIYLLLMLHYWKRGPIANEPQEYSLIARIEGEKVLSVLEEFFSLSDGMWNHKRIDSELEIARENKQRRVSRAKKAADARWNATSNATSTPQAMLNECSSPSPSPSPSNTPATDKKSARFKPPTPEEVREYATTINFNIDAEYFVDYYEGRGWFLKVGQKMKSWKAVVRTWKKNGARFQSASSHEEQEAKERAWIAERRANDGN